MRFEWDEAKRLLNLEKHVNLEKHGLDFGDAWKVFEGDYLETYDDREEYDEDRYVVIGLLNGVVVVIYTPREEDPYRILSFRKGTRNEERLYFSRFE